MGIRIFKDGHSSAQYVPGDDEIQLEGFFTAEELRTLADEIESHQRKTKGADV